MNIDIVVLKCSIYLIYKNRAEKCKRIDDQFMEVIYNRMATIQESNNRLNDG